MLQLAGIFNDSKSFVDSPLKEDPSVVLDAFARLPQQPSKAVLRQFVDDFFGAPGSNLERWSPPDFTADPSFLDSIGNATLRRFAKGIHQVWPLLGRRAAPDVARHPNRHTLLPLPHPVIVPGGRFRESYYWDSYWIVRGLLVSGMQRTAAGLVENFLTMVVRARVPRGQPWGRARALIEHWAAGPLWLCPQRRPRLLPDAEPAAAAERHGARVLESDGQRDVPAARSAVAGAGVLLLDGARGGRAAQRLCGEASGRARPEPLPRLHLPPTAGVLRRGRGDGEGKGPEGRRRAVPQPSLGRGNRVGLLFPLVYVRCSEREGRGVGRVCLPGCMLAGASASVRVSERPRLI